MAKTVKNSGQVLVMGLVMVLILLFAIFFFFDIHNILRGKMKLETAEQAAALTAARWQAESLNLVGEINLLIATESILLSDDIDVPDSDIFKDKPGDDDDELRTKKLRRIYARVQSLNEMQSRVTFIGPLIALAAAQQTAKHNGIEVVKNPDKDLSDDFDEYYERLNQPNNHIYIGYDNVNGYDWKEPYKELIKEIHDNGLAVRPSATIVGIEGVQPPYLADPYLYTAILACDKGRPAWCNYWLRWLVKQDDSYFEGTAWYYPSFELIKFSQQSEIYPIEVLINNIYTDTYDSFKTQAEILRGNNFGTAESSGFIMTQPQASEYKCRFYNYGRRWFQTDTTYTGPDVSSETPWKHGIYLRRDISDFAKYGGATAYAECVGRVPSIITFRSNFKINSAQSNDPESTTNNTESTTFNNSIQKKLEKLESDLKSIEQYRLESDKIVKKVENNDHGTLVGGNYSKDLQNSGCVAKPIGALGRNADINPTTVPIVLPVFHRANLIPSSMQKVRIFSFYWPPVEKFIVGLKDMADDGKTIYDEDLDINKYFPSNTHHMLEALRLLGTKEFRRKGWNHNFKFANLSNRDLVNLFDEQERLYEENKNPNAPGWLQQPKIHYGRNYKVPQEALKFDIYFYSSDIADALNNEILERKKLDPENKEQLFFSPPPGEIYMFYNGRYIRLNSNKEFLEKDTMENDPYKGCGVVSGNGPGMTQGTNYGPPRL